MGRDFRSATGWFVLCAVILAGQAALVASFATFTVGYADAAASPSETELPAGQGSAVRVIDPQARNVQDLEEPALLPGAPVLFGALGERADLFLTGEDGRIDPGATTAEEFTAGMRAEDLARLIRCLCAPDALEDVIVSINAAEDAAETGRRYEAVPVKELISPLERSGTLIDRLNLTLGITVSLLGGVVVAAGAHRLRAHTLRRFLIEHLHGARPGMLHLRAQLVLALGITPPLLLGFTAGRIVYAGADWPPLLPAHYLLFPALFALALHLLIGIPFARRISRTLHPKGPS
ncbi:hypothetical protein D9V32_12400 [Mycetocola tolaasinivorans]|uniref:Uncharacterized protein n=1 Tax=Mycetocola tolaasinivorans TaxID=76635 RepID=A0A3L7A375_9MICO|nr:hypothetical protein D9V32_12400 [Mycetocola tolaasinivorans]